VLKERGLELPDSVITAKRTFLAKRDFPDSKNTNRTSVLSIRPLAGSYQRTGAKSLSLMASRLELLECGELVICTITR